MACEARGPRHPDQWEKTAIARYCSSKNKLTQLAGAKAETIKPLTDAEREARDELLNVMTSCDLSCVPFKASEDPQSVLYLVRKNTSSNRAITAERIETALNDLRFDEPLGPNDLDSLSNCVYNRLREECVIQRPTVSLCTKVPKMSQSAAKEISAKLDNLQASDPQSYRQLTQGARRFHSCRQELQTTKRHFSDQRKEHLERKAEQEQLVVGYLESQPRQTRKIRVANEGGGGGSDQESAESSMRLSLQCRTVTSKRQTARFGLKQFKQALQEALTEIFNGLLTVKSSGASRSVSIPGQSQYARGLLWSRVKPILLGRLIDKLQQFQEAHAQVTEQQRLFMKRLPEPSGSSGRKP